MLRKKKIANTFMKNQISNMLNTLEVFEHSCQLAAEEDDGVIDRNEAAVLKSLHKATEEYKKKLKAIEYDDASQ